MYYQELAVEIESYICHELRESLYYRELSSIAPSSPAIDMLLEFSSDEKAHAENFKQAYYYLTGKMYVPQINDIISIPDFEGALRSRILVETLDYKRYGQNYLNAHNKYFKDLFFITRSVEARHAMKIPLLLQDKVV